MDWKSLLTPDNIESFITTIVTVVCVLVAALKTVKIQINNALQNRDASIPGKIKKQTNIDVEIMKKIEEVKEQLNADRVQVYEFHNGGHYSAGRTAFKTTCTYESCRYGVQSYQINLCNVPLNCIPNFTNKLLDDGEIEILDIKNIENSMPSTYELKKSMQITSCFDMVIRNKDGHPVGFVAIQFTKNKYNIDKSVVQKLVWFLEEKLTSSMA